MYGYLHSLGEVDANNLMFDRGQRIALINSIHDISAVKSADVQPLYIVAEHIKERLHETAFNTDEPIADMAERIDFWIDELKGGGING